MMTYNENITNDNLHEVAFELSIIYLDSTLAYSKVKIKVKVMHILMANVIIIVADGENITTDSNYKVVYRLSISIFRFNFCLL